jgi:hypothetical protein
MQALMDRVSLDDKCQNHVAIRGPAGHGRRAGRSVPRIGGAGASSPPDRADKGAPVPDPRQSQLDLASCHANPAIILVGHTLGSWPSTE